MEIEIIQTMPGDARFHLFENLPAQLYPADSLRHKQKDALNAKYLAACYVLLADGMPQARVALYNNPALNYEGKPAACIGNYESAENADFSERILLFASQEAKKSGAAFVVGPMNGSTWENYRFNSSDDRPLFFSEQCQHTYYNKQFTAAGFKPVSSYISSIDKELKCDYPDVLQRERELTEAGVKIRAIDLVHFEEELKKLYPLVTAAFENNLFYTSIDLETFTKKYVDAAQIIQPEYVLIAEDTKGNTIGFIFCYDDLYNTSEKSLIIKTIARDASSQWVGLGQVMGNQLIRLLKQRNYTSLIHAFMIEDAVSTFASRKFHGETYKKYTLYGKEI